MSISFSCSCGRKLQVKDEHAGKTGQCPACKKTFKIPMADAPAPMSRVSNVDDLEVVEDDDPRSSPSGADRLGTPSGKGINRADLLELDNHGGSALPDDADFFEPPPEEIGEVLSADTSLRKGVKPWPTASRLGLALGVAACGLVIGLPMGLAVGGKNPAAAIIGWTFILGLIGFCLTQYFTRFTHTCSYIGREGIAKFKCKGNRKHLAVDELFCFDEATELRTSQTIQYVNGIYTGTTYNFTWRDVGGGMVYRLNGGYKDKEGNPRSTDPYHFAKSAELAWTMYLLGKAFRQLELAGTVLFHVKGDDWIRIGEDHLIMSVGREKTKWMVDDIACIRVEQGRVQIRNVDAQDGWFSSSGIIQFQYDQLANAQLFFHLVDKVLGVPIG